MAIKEVRFHVKTGDKKFDRKVNRDIFDPFFWYMDALMEGRFKLYAGEELRGIDIVNYCVFTKSFIEMSQERTGQKWRLDEWINVGRTLNLETEITLDELSGTRGDKVSKALDMFSQSAASSEFPQLRLLAQQTDESYGKHSIEDAIKKSDDETGIITKLWDKLY